MLRKYHSLTANPVGADRIQGVIGRFNMKKSAWSMTLQPGSDRTKECLERNRIIIGWGVEVPPTDYFSLREAIRASYFPETKDRSAAGRAASMAYRFCNKINADDYVIIPGDDFVFYVGRVVSQNYSLDSDGFYEREVIWLEGNDELTWQSAPTDLQRACTITGALVNCNYAIPALEEFMLSMVGDPNIVSRLSARQRV